MIITVTDSSNIIHYTMKHNLYHALLAALLIMTALPVSAQQTRHELRAGLAIGEDPHLQHRFDDYLKAYPLDDDGGICGWNGGGPEWSAHLEYFYHLNQRWAVGGSVGIGTSSKSAYLPWDEKYNPEHPDPVTYVIGGIAYSLFPETELTLRSHSYFAMPTVKYTWYGHNRFRLYSKAGLGLQYYRLNVTSHIPPIPEWDEHKLKMAYQLSAVGIEVGGERMRGFTELGYGRQGIFNMGILVNL